MFPSNCSFVRREHQFWNKATGFTEFRIHFEHFPNNKDRRKNCLAGEHWCRISRSLSQKNSPGRKRQKISDHWSARVLARFSLLRMSFLFLCKPADRNTRMEIPGARDEETCAFPNRFVSLFVFGCFCPAQLLCTHIVCLYQATNISCIFSNSSGTTNLRTTNHLWTGLKQWEPCCLQAVQKCPFLLPGSPNVRFVRKARQKFSFRIHVRRLDI